MQAQRLVALAPLVTRSLVAVDDDARHLQLAQPRAERDPALPSAEDEGVRLRLVAERGLLVRALPPTSGCRNAPCTAPSTRDGPLRSSCPLSSCRAVSSVDASSPRRRRWPTPRPTAVSNWMNAETTPESSVASSSVRKPDGSVWASRDVSMSAIPSRPSTVLMFQVNATRSRQELSVANLASRGRCRAPRAPLRSRRARRLFRPCGVGVEFGFIRRPLSRPPAASVLSRGGRENGVGIAVAHGVDALRGVLRRRPNQSLLAGRHPSAPPPPRLGRAHRHRRHIGQRTRAAGWSPASTSGSCSRDRHNRPGLRYPVRSFS